MHGTTPTRQNAARLLAKMVVESGSRAGAFGWVDSLAPRHLSPSIRIESERKLVWRLAPGTAVLPVATNSRRRWEVWLERPEHLERRAPLMTYVAGWLQGYVETIEEDPPKQTHAHGWMCGALEGMRDIGFLPQAYAAEIVGNELRRLVEDEDRDLQEVVESVARELASPLKLGDALSTLGNTLDRRGALAAATTVHEVCFDLAIATQDVSLGIDCSRWAARAHRKSANWSSAHSWYGLAARLAEFEGDLGRLATVLDGVGNTHVDRGAHKQARTVYADALRIGTVAGNTVAVAGVRQNLMFLERAAARLPEALEHGWEALNMLEDGERRGAVLIELAGVFAELGRRDLAAEAYRAGYDLVSETDLRALGLLGQAWIAALEGDSALSDQANRDLTLLEGGVSPRVEAQLLLYRGKRQLELGRATAGHDELERAIDFAETHGFARQLIEAEKAIQRQRQPSPPAIWARERVDTISAEFLAMGAHTALGGG
jgi:tetratricopeptide (TPR) repeat protein